MMARLRTGVAVPNEVELDMFFYRTQGEVSYARHLGVVSTTQLNRWRGKFMVSGSAACFQHPQVRAEFRCLRKTGPYWMVPVRQERRSRSALGYLVTNQNVEAYYFRDHVRATSYVMVTRLSGRLEVAQGRMVELSPIVSYVGSEFIEDPSSGWWVVVFSEFFGKTG